MNTNITKIVVLMDNDQAGKEAAMDMYRKLSRSHKLIFPKMSNKDIGDMQVSKIKKSILNKLEGLY